MKLDFSDADFSGFERQLRERHVMQAAELRSRILGAVSVELDAKHNAQSGSGAWPYAAMAACLLLGLGLAQAAAITSLIPEGTGQREEAAVSIATLRRLCPELSEDDARQVAPFVSLPRMAVALPSPQPDLSPIQGDVNTQRPVRGEPK